MEFAFTMVAGSDLRVNVSVQDFTGNLTSATEIEIVFKDCETDSADLVKLKTEGDIVVTGATAFYMTLVPADTISLHGQYYMDGQVTIDGKKYPLRESDYTYGLVTIKKTIIS